MATLSEKLFDQGVDLKSHTTGTHKVTCPKCSHLRKKKNEPCLWVHVMSDTEAAWKCYNGDCGWTGGVKSGVSASPAERKREYTKPAYEPKEEDLPKRALDYLAKRKISPETCRRHKIVYRVGEHGGEFQFPYFVDGEVVNVKHRGDGKKFMMEKGARLTFYGLDDVKDTDEVVIVEGEFDKLALEEVGVKNVISVPNGHNIAKNKEKDEDLKNQGRFEYLAHAADRLLGKKRFLLCVDQDEVGRDLEWELARRLGRAKCFRVRMPEKDANDTLIKHGPDVLRQCLLQAEPYPIDGLYSVNDFAQAVMDQYDRQQVAGKTTGWENVDNFYTVAPGRLTVVTGIPSHGKSEFVDALLVNLADHHGDRFAIFSPEHEKERHVEKLCEKHMLKPFFNKRFKNRGTKEELANGLVWCSRFFHFIDQSDDEKEATIDWILDRARDAVMRHGITGLVIDPYNEIEHQRPKDVMETEYISKFLSRLKKFARNHGLHVWLVAHPYKLLPDKDGKFPRPTLYSISGSANFFNKCDNGIVVYRLEEGNKVEIHFEKIKFKNEGQKGKATMQYDIRTGTYKIPEGEKSYTDDNGREVRYSKMRSDDEENLEEIPF